MELICIFCWPQYLVLAIPILLIYRIQIKWRQKLGLTITLCLTLAMIAVTIIRVSGLKTPDGQTDALWVCYWNIISAEIGIIMTAATAFRTLFVSRNGAGRNNPPAVHKPNITSRLPFSWSSWLMASKRYLQRTFSLRDKNSAETSDSSERYKLSELDEVHQGLDLPTMPRPCCR